MKLQGLDIQSYTVTKRNLGKYGRGESLEAYFKSVEMEVAQSKSVLEQKLKAQIKYLAYPEGATNKLVIEVLKKQGYRGAFTLRREGNGFFVNNFRIHRSLIYGSYRMSDFQKNLSVFKNEALR